jgi:hypothetical protein
MASPFDAGRLKVTGSPVEVVTDVAAQSWVGGQASISQNGTLIYLKQPPPEARTLEWVDLDGRSTPLPVSAAQYAQAEGSPDGRKVAAVRRE